MRFLLIIVIIIAACSQKQVKPKLLAIDLSSKDLKSIPDSVFEHTETEYLHLGSKAITFYPPLSALADEEANDLTDVPNSIGALTNLKTLILTANQLTALPDSITRLTKLETLDLSLNRNLDVVQQVEKIKQLPNLRVLKMTDTKFSKLMVDTIQDLLGKHVKVISTIDEYLKNFN